MPTFPPICTRAHKHIGSRAFGQVAHVPIHGEPARADTRAILWVDLRRAAPISGAASVPHPRGPRTSDIGPRTSACREGSPPPRGTHTQGVTGRHPLHAFTRGGYSRTPHATRRHQRSHWPPPATRHHQRRICADATRYPPSPEEDTCGRHPLHAVTGGGYARTPPATRRHQRRIRAELASMGPKGWGPLPDLAPRRVCRNKKFTPLPKEPRAPNCCTCIVLTLRGITQHFIIYASRQETLRSPRN